MQVGPFGQSTDRPVDLLLVVLEVPLNTTVVEVLLLLKNVGYLF